MVAISVDPPDQTAKMNSLIDGRVRLLGAPDLSVIRQFEMEMVGGGLAGMGYVVANGEGQIIAREVDPLFGYHVPEIRAVLSQQ